MGVVLHHILTSSFVKLFLQISLEVAPPIALFSRFFIVVILFSKIPIQTTIRLSLSNNLLAQTRQSLHLLLDLRPYLILTFTTTIIAFLPRFLLP